MKKPEVIDINPLFDEIIKESYVEFGEWLLKVDRKDRSVPDLYDDFLILKSLPSSYQIEP